MLTGTFKALIFSAVLLGISACNPSPEFKTRSLETAWTITDQLCEPETVLHDEKTDRLIISNICGFKANGEGYLMLADPDGQILEPKWVTGLNAPAGMAMSGRDLFVVDIDRVHMIDLDTGEIIDELIPSLPAKAFNDIAIDENGTIYVSDSALAHIVKFKDGESTVFPDAEAKFGFANGLHVRDSTLYIGGKYFWTVDLETGHIETDDRPELADIDGIESDGNDGLIISIVGGNVIALPEHGPPKIWTAPGLSSTNHAYLPDEKLVIVPTGYDNTVLALKRPG